MNIQRAIKQFINPMPEDVGVEHDPNIPLEVRDMIAPPTIEVDFDHIKVGDQFHRTLFVVGYPRFVSANWLEPLISFNHTLDVSMYIYPTKSEEILENLKRKVGEMEATIQSDMKRGRVIEPSIQVSLEDALSLQQELARGAERFFQFGLYITIPSKTLSELDKITKQVEATLGSLLIITKKAVLAMDEGFRTTLPMGQDRIMVTRNMDTTTLATTFPFTTSELSANEGVLYGMNEHNGSLIIFDRFTLENANMVVFGKSVASWEPVLVRENGVVHKGIIGDIVESLIQKHGITYKDEDLEGVRDPALEVFSYNNALHGEWTRVSVAARKPFSKRERLYKLTTRSGREITVTGDHSLITLRDGRVTAARGRTIRRGDVVPLPRTVHGGGATRAIIKPRSLLASSWPDSLPTSIPIETPLLTLLGLTTAEGFVTEKVLTIYNTDPVVLDTIKRAASAVGALVASRNDQDHQIKGYNIQPNAYARLFVAMGAGGKSGEKRVPPIVFTLPKVRVAQYLCAYFEGDGTVGKHVVSCTSKSKRLISDIAYLLLYFGIIGRMHIKQKRATNSNHAGDTYHELTISGADELKAFAGEIGFLTQRKTKALHALLGKTANTNVNTIPTLGPTIGKLHDMLYCGDCVAAPINVSPLSRNVFQPSPKELKNIILAAEQRIAHLQKLRERVQLLSRLPELEEIIRRGNTNKRLNALLWKNLGQTWRLMKRGAVIPRTTTVLRAYETITGERFVAPHIIKQTLYECFKEMGVSLLAHNKSLWTSVVLEARKQGDASYATLYDAVVVLKKRYRSLQLKLRHAKRILAGLKKLADADLFWDPVVRKEKIKHNERYVYDLTVDNHVFLAGHGGMFVHNSGGGKSYFVKLEAMRSLMFDTEVIIIDPENEYQALTHALGGEYIRFHFGTETKINPFDLALLRAGSGESELNQKILSLHGFFRVVMGTLTPTEDAILDRALILTYKQRGITPDPATQGREPPLMEDLYKSLIGMEEPAARGLADRIEKFVKGSLVGIFDQQTNVEIRNPLTVFSIRDLEEELRPIAMYLILDFIWTKVRRDLKRRLLIVDEAWYMMKFPDSAYFMNSIAKRARKYYLGVTTISQDVEDFLSTDLGRAIIQNSSLQVLLKQSTAAIDRIAEAFFLSEGEKHLLLSADIGEGLFFAGPAHAAMRIIASPTEHELVTTKPQDLIAQSQNKSSVSAPTSPHNINGERLLPASNRPLFTVETVAGNGE